jgi:hypothetical protein
MRPITDPDRGLALHGFISRLGERDLVMSSRALKFWKWTLLVAQVLFVGHQLALLLIPRSRAYDGLPALASMMAMALWAFLLLGSPFFWRSHRWLAYSGSFVAVGLPCFLLLGRW